MKLLVFIQEEEDKKPTGWATPAMNSDYSWEDNSRQLLSGDGDVFPIPIAPTVALAIRRSIAIFVWIICLHTIMGTDKHFEVIVLFCGTSSMVILLDQVLQY